MTGSPPSRVCAQACLQPVLTRCGVMTHQARAISRRRDGGQASPPASSASPMAARAMSQAAPSQYPLASATVASPADRPSWYRQFQIRPQMASSPPGRVEASVPVTPPQPAGRLGDLPLPPVSLGVVRREPPVAQPPQETGQPVQRPPDREGDPGPRGTATRSISDQCRRWRPWPLDQRRAVAFAGAVANVDHIASPSSSVQSLAGVSLGRCCSTGPAARPGYRAVGNYREPGSFSGWPRMSGRGPCACAPGKRTWSSRAKRYGSALPSSRAGVAWCRDGFSRPARPRRLARDLLSVTFGSPRPVVAGR